MKLTPLALTVVLLGTVGLAIATPPPTNDESALAVNLWDVNHLQLFVKCASGKDVTKCQNPTVWQNTNIIKGLQTAISDDDGAVPADDPILS